MTGNPQERTFVRPATGMAALVLLGLTACSSGGTPAPSSVTVTPTLHWATPSATGTPRPTTPSRPRSTQPTPVAGNRSLLLTPERIGTLALGVATPVDTRGIDDLLGAHRTGSACAGRTTTMTWGGLTIAFVGTPALARAWEVTVSNGTAGLRLPRGIEWSPERESLLTRDDATTTRSGKKRWCR